jgi:hypothetical protein
VIPADASLHERDGLVDGDLHLTDPAAVPLRALIAIDTATNTLVWK